jgi:xanthosine utilization system XapX-like protein
MNSSTTPAGRRYIARFIPAMLAYVGVLCGTLWAIRTFEPTGPLLWVLAIAPAVPVIAVIAIMGLYLMEETDEFIRAVLVQSMLWGVGITLSACTAWGFLENADVVPHIPLYLVFPMFCGSFGLAQPFVRRRYQ